MITIGYITSRQACRFDWFFESLRNQLHSDDEIQIVIVDFFAQEGPDWTPAQVNERHRILTQRAALNGFHFVTHSPPKPTVWQGPNRLPKDNWWAASNARNTALCLAQGEWWACVDDRSVLMPGWMHALRDAIKNEYVVFGTYEKRTGVTVKNGNIKHAGIITGEDGRLEYVKKYWEHSMKNPYQAPPEWLYGCSFALPTEWALRVNGFDETCDGSSGEDYIFGMMLHNQGFPLMFDRRMLIIEDRTPEHIGVPMVRKDKGVSPNDKSHALLAKLKGQRTAQHPYDIRQIRTQALKGFPWPAAIWPTVDWYDGQQIKDMTPP